MTKAQKYLQDRKPDIEISLKEDNRLQELDNFLSFLNETIESLKPLRLNDDATTHKLNEIFKISRNILYTSWLTKAFANDKSFVYAYNYLAQKRNRENGSVVYPVTIPVDYNEIEKFISIEIYNLELNYPYFDCNLGEKKLKELFSQLITHSFIDTVNIVDDFLYVFGINSDQYRVKTKIKWIDKSVTRHEPNIQTLYEFIYLLKPYIKSDCFDTSVSNQNNLYGIIRFHFDGVNNISVKNPCKVLNNTKRKQLLKSIVENLQS